jgi:hypothetical protein
MPLKFPRSRAPKAARALMPAGALLCSLLVSPLAEAVDLWDDATLGGSLALTSDAIYRGVSESNGQVALQGDLHIEDGGSFVGVWTSTRDTHLAPYADYDVEVYLGHRFDLTNAWSSTLSARAHYFVAGMQQGSTDYEELTASLTWLDRWTLALSAIPNATHYVYYAYDPKEGDDGYQARLERSPAWVAETSGQWLLRPEGLFVTGGAGYYYSSRTGVEPAASGGYAYGNAGVAFEHGPWRADVGYFAAQGNARALIAYAVPVHRLAATLAWRF